VRDEEALVSAFTGADVVFHVASYGMSGSSQLQRSIVRDINVTGTKNVLSAARKAGVPRLVFTSTYNVVFGGRPIEGGDERMPYFPFQLHCDEYSRTKGEAESLVIAANMTPLSQADDEIKGKEYSPRYLRTCVVRPAAIWGPGEQRHMPRVVSYVERGLFRFLFGSKRARMDFVHVNNLVQAHIKAADALTAEAGHVSAGQAYFVSDGEEKAINNFEFFRQIVEGLGYSMPTLRLPLQFVYFVAFLTEIFYWVVSPAWPFEPLLTRAEVLKAGVSHWFVISKARKDLGYQPVEYSFDEVVQVFKARGHGTTAARQHRVIDTEVLGLAQSSAWWWELLMVVLILLILGRLAVQTGMNAMS